MSGIKTRQQEDMARALAHVRQVRDSGIASSYGNLCLKVPVLVQTNGLCQALAFLEDKGKGSANGPHQTVLKHISEVLGIERERLLDTVQEAPLMEYIMYSRRIMEAWVYYKRFSVSFLDADLTSDDEEG